MSKFLQLTRSMNGKLALLTGVFTLGFVIFGSMALSTLNTAKVHGPHYNRVVQNKDLLADVLPPPNYIVETYLTAHLMADYETDAELNGYIEQIDKLKQEYDERQDHWKENLEDGVLKTEINETSRKPAEKFFTVVENELVPLLRKKDHDAAREVLAEKLDPLYAEHRASVDKIVETTIANAESTEAEVGELISWRQSSMLFIGFAILASVGGFAFWLSRSVRSQELASARLTSMMDQAPSNIMFADTDFNIQYMNPASLKTLQSIQEHLPIKPEEMVGRSIDIFHKRPEHQRRLLADPTNLPVQSQISVGPETLDLMVSPVFDQNKNYLGAMVTWDVITEKLRTEKEIARVNSMVEQAPINIMFADTDFNIRYMNPASLKTLKGIESELPIRAEEIVGKSVDMFHKNPAHQRRILSDPSNLPVQSQITVGSDELELKVSAVNDPDGNHLGAMVTWEVITERLEMERKIKEQSELERQKAEETQRKVDVVLELVNQVSDGKFDVQVPDLGQDAIGKVAAALDRAVQSVRDALTEVREVSSTVGTAANQMTGASEEIASGAQKQAARLEETASSLEEITTTVQQNSENAQEARQLANGSRDVATEGGKVVSDAVQAMSEINDSSKKIADIITTIDEIAFQTNLLALNAAVEAARAGEQGRGFAVVAAEVRNLAQRSASSAKEIKSLIQDSAAKVDKGTDLVNRSGETLGEIVDSVKRVTDIVAEIAAASQEQLTGIQQVNKAVGEMDRVTQANASQTEEMTGTAGSVLNHASQLNDLVSRFQLGNAPVGGHHSSSAAPAPTATATSSSGNAGYSPADRIDEVIEAVESDEFMEF